MPIVTSRPFQAFRKQSVRGAIALALGLAAFLGAPAAAHDDAKIRDRQKPVYGRPYRADVDGEGGVAGGSFASNGVQLRSWLPLNTLAPGSTSGNSCWGYVSPAGREYAIIGISNGTAFVEITSPGNSVLRSFQPGPTSLWRDVRVHGQYCYAASEAGSGIQVFDLSQLDASGTTTLVNTVLAPTSTTASTHTLAVDNVSGFLYRAGGGSNGLRFYDLQNPANPTFVGSWSPIYVHECQVLTYTSGPYAGKQIAFACGGGNSGYANTGLYIVDVTNKAAPVQLGFVSYPGARYCHQGWLDRTGRYFYINDELDEGDTTSVTTTLVIDVQNLSAPVFAGSFNNGNPAVGHNLFVKGTLLFEANYRSGLRVFDIGQNPLNPPEVAFFDTYPGSDSPNFNGLWNIWPFFPSGTVIGSDIERGLFVWTLAPAVASFAVASPPALVNPAGGTPVDVTVTPLGGATLDPESGTMTVTVGAGAPTEVPLAPVSGNVWRALFPAATCTSNVQYRFAVASTSGNVTEDSVQRQAIAAAAVDEIVRHNFETAAGWVGGVFGDTATGGVWTRVDPIGTSAQPGDDHSPDGTICWITGQGSNGGQAGEADVDGGVTTLLSPVFDMTGFDEPQIEYWYWYSNNQGSNPGTDSMPVQISNDGGTTWVDLENVTTNNAAWTFRKWRVRDFVTPTASVRVRFRAQDLGAGSLVEAGVDDFRVVNVDCTVDVPGDVNGDGVVDALDLAVVLAAWGTSGGAADLNGDGVVDALDLAAVVAGWTL